MWGNILTHIGVHHTTKELVDNPHEINLAPLGKKATKESLDIRIF
jgi:hypothetical protein